MESDSLYDFKYKISKDILCNYLARTVTVAPCFYKLSKTNTPHIKKFILNTNAKYIQRAATCWIATLEDFDSYKEQKAFIDDMHGIDPDIIFEACIFENVTFKVNDIPIPDWIFRDFGLAVEKRNFSFEKMCFPSGKYLGQWGENTSVPDITRIETMMFMYYRACEYIKAGFEGLHMGQVHLIGENDTGWKCWTKLLNMIREFAYHNARRNMVLINAHTHGIIGSDGLLLFDFHAFPSRPMADCSQKAHKPSENDPQKALFEIGHFDSIYSKSLGGKTHSGWSCDSLPYLVELDNYDDLPDPNHLNIPDKNDVRCWGMDEITWFANQPQSYRSEFLKYAYEWVKSISSGNGFFALPCERIAAICDKEGNFYRTCYFAYNSDNYADGNNDEEIIKEILK